MILNQLREEHDRLESAREALKAASARWKTARGLAASLSDERARAASEAVEAGLRHKEVAEILEVAPPVVSVLVKRYREKSR